MRRITDQGFVVLVHFMSAGPDALLTAREVSDALDLPAATTAKVLKVLQRGGLLTSTRGLLGGYALAVDPQTTTVKTVIEAFEGPLALTGCSVVDAITCDSHDTCQLAHAWPVINTAVVAALEGVTLSELVRNGKIAQAPAADEPTASSPG